MINRRRNFNTAGYIFCSQLEAIMDGEDHQHSPTPAGQIHGEAQSLPRIRFWVSSKVFQINTYDMTKVGWNELFISSLWVVCNYIYQEEFHNIFIHVFTKTSTLNRVRAFVVYVIHRYGASVLVTVNSSDVLVYNKRLFDVTLVIWPPQVPESPIVV